jgi:hypothetical protein
VLIPSRKKNLAPSSSTNTHTHIHTIPGERTIRRNMSKKEDEEEQPMLVGKKKCWQRWQWLENRRRRRERKKGKKRSNIIDQNQKHRNISGGRNRSAVRSRPPSILPPLSWSSTSLISHLQSEHYSNKNCLESSWKWSKSLEDDSTTILLDNNTQILFHPRTSSSTQVILADRPLPSNGKHYWEIYMPAVYGTSIMFGIASKIINIMNEIKN